MTGDHSRRVPGAAAIGVAIAIAAAVALLLNVRHDSTNRPPEKHRFWITTPPPPAGSAKAPVKAEFFVEQRSPCNCSYELALLGRALGELEPKQLRVIFWNSDLPEGRERLRRLGALGSHLGLALNGRSRFRVKDTYGRTAGARKDLNLLAKERLWTLPDLYYAVDEELRKAHAPPLNMTSAQFESRLSARMEQLRQVVPSDGSDSGPASAAAP